MRSLAPRPMALVLALLCASLVGVRADCQPGAYYAAKIQRTTYGIPHVYAEDYGGLGYGYGYAFAQDNFCVLAREIVDATAEASRYFGPGGGRLNRDLFYAFWSSDAVVQRFFDEIEPELQELAEGYAAGYNRYLRETGVANLPDACRDAPWVREIDVIDLFKVYYKLVDRAGASNVANFLVAAEPPTGMAAAPESAAAERARIAAQTPEQWRAEADIPVLKPEEMGSNMVAAGRDATETGTGMLLVNPHFPWGGSLRFYQVHLTIPGVIDSMGASLFGSPLPNIAFNENVAWSHTVSAASRFMLRQLVPAPGDPTSYLMDGVPVPMEPHTVSVQVLQPDGSLTTESHTFWDTEFGPVMAIPPLLLWSSAAALAVQDPARDNYRIFDLFLRMNTAKNLDEFVTALNEEVALPWVNTVATDRSGEVFYGDVGTVPNVNDALIADCSTVLTPFVEGFGLLLLDGSRSECKSPTDPDSPQPGILGASNLPQLRRTDWVQNSNDSYWLTHPEEPLEGFSPLLGGERERQSLRTRLGIVQIQQRLAGTDGLPGDRFDLAAMQHLVQGNRNHSAELFLDAVLTLCAEEPNLVGGVDVGPACAALAGWSRRNDTDAVGALVWRAAWPNIDDVPDLFAVPFDVNDPVNTPRGVRLDDPAVRSGVMEELADAVAFLADNGLAVDAAWGEVHFDEKLGMRIPIPGGPGGHGVYNAIGTGFQPGKGYAPISGGTSILMTIAFPKKGGVDARGLLTYSQSSDPANPHYKDQTELFSVEGWNDLPFRPGEIRANRISKIEIAEPR